MARSAVTQGINIVGKSYRGNALDGRLMYCGFQPDAVMIFGNSTVAKVLRTSAMSNTAEFENDSALFADGVQDFHAKGFELGADSRVNGDGVMYYYIAIKSSYKNCSVGSYTGNGTNGKIISGLGFQPDIIIIRGHGSRKAVIWDKDMTGGNAHLFSGSTPAADYITGVNSDGFILGVSARTNTNNEVFSYIAIKLNDDDILKLGSYTGNGTDNRDLTGVGFQPDVVLIKNQESSNNRAACIKTKNMPAGNSLVFINQADKTNNIQAIAEDGFQLGTDTTVNEADKNYHYYAFKFHRERLPVS